MYPIKTMDQKSIIIWDDFRGQQSQLTTDMGNNYNFVTIMVPTCSNHLIWRQTTLSKIWEKLPSEITLQTQSRRSFKLTLKKCDNDQSRSQLATLQIYPYQNDDKNLSPLQKWRARINYEWLGGSWDDWLHSRRQGWWGDRFQSFYLRKNIRN